MRLSEIAGFGPAGRIVDGKTPAYEVVLLDLRKDELNLNPVSTFTLMLRFRMPDRLDTIVIPGGKGLHTNPTVRTRIANRLQEVALEGFERRFGVAPAEYRSRFR